MITVFYCDSKPVLIMSHSNKRCTVVFLKRFLVLCFMFFVLLSFVFLFFLFLGGGGRTSLCYQSCLLLTLSSWHQSKCHARAWKNTQQIKLILTNLRILSLFWAVLCYHYQGYKCVVCRPFQIKINPPPQVCFWLEMLLSHFFPFLNKYYYYYSMA